MGRHSLLSLSCFAAAGAWPTLVTALGSAMMSPLERAMQDSICGAPLHTAPALLGHCAACWAGSAILAATGIVVLMSNAKHAARVKAD
ncbi:hypothetical protein U91I_01804 [alpha proteobacterium U9-1i]|nr:hypothetical protein U91I_01804 [alpha proteobacterium U9-1i]